MLSIYSVPLSLNLVICNNNPNFWIFKKGPGVLLPFNQWQENLSQES